jgi:hypothetical protein
MAKFHRHSLRNIMLIAMEKPTATYVPGFHVWHKLGHRPAHGQFFFGQFHDALPIRNIEGMLARLMLGLAFFLMDELKFLVPYRRRFPQPQILPQRHRQEAVSRR